MEQVNTSEIVEIAINGDPNRVIRFDPNDALFAEKFYKMQNSFNSKLTEYAVKVKTFSNRKDDNGVPEDIGKRIELIKELCLYIRGEIDNLFGSGTSQIAFGDALNIHAIEAFLTGVIPYFGKARKEKVNKYARK